MNNLSKSLSEHQPAAASNEYVLFMSSDIYRSIAAHCEAELPNEACGLLVADAGMGAESNSNPVIERFIPIPNRHPEPRHAFAFDPAAWTAALYELERLSQKVIGYYHSHPATSPVPSRSDIAGLPASSSAYMLILSFASPTPEARAYRFTQGQHPSFSEVRMK